LESFKRSKRRENGRTDIISDKDEINKCLGNHFGTIGTDSSLEPEYKDRILDFIKEKETRCHANINMLSVLFTKDSISDMLKSLKSGKAPGLDDIPNEFLKQIYLLPFLILSKYQKNGTEV